MKSALLLSSALLLMHAPSHAQAVSGNKVQTAEAVRSKVIKFNIPDQNLEQALFAFSRQANVQLLVTPADVRLLKSAPVIGQKSPREAIRTMLHSLPLSAQWIGSSTLLIKQQPSVRHISTAAIVQDQLNDGDVRPAPEPALSNAGDFGVDEIIVTAQKRAENVQDVPVTVAVVGGKQLAQQNIVTTTDLVQAVPALTVTNFGVFQVRSLGTQGFAKSAEQSVSVVLDGMALPRPLAYQLTNAMFDVDHVEVLSGPQGTLFGKNASAGVISITTKAPTLGRFEGIAHLDVGNHDVVNAQAVLNIPFGDNAALRIVAHHNTNGNIVYNTLFRKWDHNVDDGVRARLLWEPTDTLRINLFGDYQHARSNGVNGISGYLGVPIIRAAAPGSLLESTLAGCGIVASPSNNRVCGDTLYDPNVKRGDVYGGRRRGGSIHVDWDFLDGYSFTSITGYRHDGQGDFDVDGEFAGGSADTLPLNMLQRNLFPSSLKMFSQETRIQSPADDKINFVAGLYYSRTRLHDRANQAGQFGANLGAEEYRRVNDVYSKAINYAAFGQINFDATDKLRFLAGGRVTRDRLSTIAVNSYPDESPNGPYRYTGNKGFFSLYPINSCTLAGGDPGSGHVTGSPTSPASCPAGTSLTEPGRLSETGYTWKLGVQYDLASRTMVYATFTRGYKLDFAPLCGVAGEVSHAVIELSRDFDDVAAERGR